MKFTPERLAVKVAVGAGGAVFAVGETRGRKGTFCGAC